MTDYLAHYGRKGMKWGKHIFLDEVADRIREEADRQAVRLNANTKTYADDRNKPISKNKKDTWNRLMWMRPNTDKEKVASKSKSLATDNQAFYRRIAEKQLDKITSGRKLSSIQRQALLTIVRASPESEIIKRFGKKGRQAIGLDDLINGKHYSLNG